jgi:hypothetical protein
MLAKMVGEGMPRQPSCYTSVNQDHGATHRPNPPEAPR